MRKKETKEKDTDFLNEMEMRSAMASYVAMGGSEEPWFGWSFKRHSYSAVLFCLRMLYDFKEADAYDLYEDMYGLGKQ